MEKLTSWLYEAPAPPTKFLKLKEMKFFIGDEEHTVRTSNIPADMTLNSYLRQVAFLTGTKGMCLEGGCGACVVAVTIPDPISARECILAVNSCLVPIYMCSSWKIHAVESIGNLKNGYHPIQKALVKFNGTQCGFCTPGMVMSMYALYESGDFTMKDVENSFGGNICRCTGYRAILSAFKSLATDASPETLGTVADIEDFSICSKIQNQRRNNWPIERPQQLSAHFYKLSESRWFKVFSINEIFDVFREYPGASYLLLSGDTAKGVYKRTEEPLLYIDITCVKVLLGYAISDTTLIVGANMTLTNTLILFKKLAKEHAEFSYLNKMAEHIELIANVPVRNVGTLAGNLFTKYKHPEFLSDIFVIFETVGVSVTLMNQNKEEKVMSLSMFLDFNMESTIIKHIHFPALDDTYKFESYKIMPRAENSHALLSAGFLFKFSKGKVESARIVYGGIRSTFIHATEGEKCIINKDLFDNSTMQILFKTLYDEIQPDDVLPNPPPEFRKKLSVALCYKFILSIAPNDKVSSENRSGGLKQIRPVSSGTQDYETNESLYPLTQPISKIEAMAQCCGSAEYIMDMPDRPGQLYAAFVLANAPADSVITKIDPSTALDLKGVVSFYSKDDIPGRNTFTAFESKIQIVVEEELFCSGTVQYFHQPVGIAIATSQKLAEEAAVLIDITYAESKQKPLLTIEDILNANANDRIHFESKHDATSRGNDVKHIIKGKYYNGWQYHFTMETQCCVAVPVEDGLDLYPSTQCVDAVQVCTSKVLNIPVNRINIDVRRIGGAYGAKGTRSSMTACAAALAAYKLQKPVKLWMPLSTNMNVIGKRFPAYCTYEVGCDDNGTIQYLKADVYTDFGKNAGNENYTNLIGRIWCALYKSDTWDFKIYSTRSDCHPGTQCRAPSRTEAVAIMESIMEHIASKLNIDPLQVRYRNMNSPEITKYLGDLVQWAEIDKRKRDIKEFNKANRWVKRGIAAVPMLYNINVFGQWNVLVTIYQGDGSVSVAHAGIEMGQGINTKAAQVCAYSLGVPLNQVSIRPTNSMVTPNATPTVASITSEAICFGIIKACDELKQRMDPVKKRMGNPTFQQLIRQCHLENISLTANGRYTRDMPEVKDYIIYGATCVETEVDILTGAYQIKRVDLIEDTGNSMSPQIDIGQVEGAFIMGLGYWTMEEIIFGPNGQLLTNNTWTYKTPGAKDIPIDFRVKFPKENPNPVGVLHSKATGEPALVMSCAVPFAIRNALSSARIQADPNAEKWYHIDGPSTVADTFLKSLHNYEQYKL